jgi:hypothetical protein
MGYRKRGPKPKPLVVQVNTFSWPWGPPMSPSLDIATGPTCWCGGRGTLQDTSVSPFSQTFRAPPPPYPMTQLQTLGTWGTPDAPGMPWADLLPPLAPPPLRYLPLPVAPMS